MSELALQFNAEGFGDEVVAAQEMAMAGVAAGGEDIADEEALAEQDAVPVPAMLPAPAASQIMNDFDEEAGDDDGPAYRAIDEKFPEQNALAFHRRDVDAKLWTHLTENGTPPLDIMNGIEAQVAAMSDDDPSKADSVLMWNLIVQIYNRARGTAGKPLRDILVQLFTAQSKYYDTREEIADLREDQRISTQIYNEREMAAAIKKVQAAQEAREKANEAKTKKLSEARAAKAAAAKAKAAEKEQSKAEGKRART